jgi:hypothetical protein
MKKPKKIMTEGIRRVMARRKVLRKRFERRFRFGEGNVCFMNGILNVRSGALKQWAPLPVRNSGGKKGYVAALRPGQKPRTSKGDGDIVIT